jgi:hypothetical protein
VVITSGNLVITVLKGSRKDSYDQPFAARRQAPQAVVVRGRLPYIRGKWANNGPVQLQKNQN